MDTQDNIRATILDLMASGKHGQAAFIVASQELRICQQDLFEASCALRDQRDQIVLDAAKGDPKALGANEATREANLRALTAFAQSEVDQLDLNLILLRSNMESARFLLENLKLQFRSVEMLMEVSRAK